MDSHPRDSVAQNYRQAYGYDGQPPPHGYGRPGRHGGGLPSWAKVLIIVLVLFFGGCAGLIGFGIYSMKRAGILPNIPRAKVHTGTPVKWQELAHWKGGGMLSAGLEGPGLFSGNFDSDPQPELFLIRPPALMGNPLNPGSAVSTASNMSVFELAGTERKLNIGTAPYLLSGDAWDYDGDGVKEIVTWNSKTEVYDLSGKFVALLPGSFNFGGGQTQADLDGDGRPELLLMDPMNNGNTVAIGLKGKQLWSSNVVTYGGVWGNIDSDKLAEYVDPLGTGNGPVGTDMKGQATTLSGWPSSSLNGGNYGMETLCCADIDADGFDEVIDPRRGYLNPDSAAFVNFARPVKTSGMQSYMPDMSQSRAVAGDFDGDSTRELAVTDSAGSSSIDRSCGTAIVIYRADGSLQYYEEFGTQVRGLVCVREGQRDRLAVLLAGRLLLQR